MTRVTIGSAQDQPNQALRISPEQQDSRSAGCPRDHGAEQARVSGLDGPHLSKDSIVTSATTVTLHCMQGAPCSAAAVIKTRAGCPLQHPKAGSDTVTGTIEPRPTAVQPRFDASSTPRLNPDATDKHVAGNTSGISGRVDFVWSAQSSSSARRSELLICSSSSRLT